MRETLDEQILAELRGMPKPREPVPASHIARICTPDVGDVLDCLHRLKKAGQVFQVAPGLNGLPRWVIPENPPAVTATRARLTITTTVEYDLPADYEHPDGTVTSDPVEMLGIDVNADDPFLWVEDDRARTTVTGHLLDADGTVVASVHESQGDEL